MWVAFATHIFFSKNISVYAIFNDEIFNDTLRISLSLNNWALNAKSVGGFVNAQHAG